jgi:hypothetical protein
MIKILCWTWGMAATFSLSTQVARILIVDELQEASPKNKPKAKQLRIKRSMIKFLPEHKLTTIKAIERDPKYKLRFKPHWDK